MYIANIADPSLFQRRQRRLGFAMPWPLLRLPQSGHEPAMSSLPPVQCLLCNHLNPAGVRFCNDCGSQLHLLPCEKCGVMNKRNASNCYKCGAGFTLPPAPAVLYNQLARPVLSDVVIAKKHTPVPKPLARQVDATVASAAGATSGSERSWWLASLVILLATVGMSGYYYFVQSAAVPKTQGAILADSRVAGTPIAGSATAPTVTPQNGAAPVPGDTTSTSTAASGRDTALALAPPAADPAVTVRSSSPNDAQATTLQDPPPLFKECPPAVAALGFCNPGTKHEEQ